MKYIVFKSRQEIYMVTNEGDVFIEVDKRWEPSSYTVDEVQYLVYEDDSAVVLEDL